MHSILHVIREFTVQVSIKRQLDFLRKILVKRKSIILIVGCGWLLGFYGP